MAQNALPSENDEVKLSTEISFDDEFRTVSLKSQPVTDCRHQPNSVRSIFETIGDEDDAILEALGESSHLKFSCQTSMIAQIRANVIFGFPEYQKNIKLIKMEHVTIKNQLGGGSGE